MSFDAATEENFYFTSRGSGRVRIFSEQITKCQNNHTIYGEMEFIFRIFKKKQLQFLSMLKLSAISMAIVSNFETEFRRKEHYFVVAVRILDSSCAFSSPSSSSSYHPAFHLADSSTHASLPPHTQTQSFFCSGRSASSSNVAFVLLRTIAADFTPSRDLNECSRRTNLMAFALGTRLELKSQIERF